jgi:GT2 family glycosyltransferase
MTNVQLSIVTVNYNGFKDTCELIESLQKHLLSLTYEVVVVDNASRNNEADALRQRYPGVTLVKSDRNLGFAGGNNLGIKAAQGEYILLLNNDTYVKEDTFGYLIETLRQHPEAGAVSPLLLYARDERTIQYAGFTPLTSVTLRNKSIGNGETEHGQFTAPCPTAFAHGAALCFHRSLLDTAGYLPECYFLYYEELDWCMQIQHTGRTIWFDPRCKVYHKESQSTGIKSPLQAYYMTRNRLLFTRRQRTGLTRYLSYLYQYTVVLTRDVLRDLFTGKTRQATAALRGAYSFTSLK